MNRIFYTKPSITQREIDSVTEAATYGWGDRCYEKIEEFEARFREYLQVDYAHATSSCTGALHLGYEAIGIKPGDEVIIGEINWIATASAITYLGARPVFVDVLRDTWCIDPAKIEAAITSKTKAIVAVHIYGNLCEMDEIRTIAKKHNLYLVEDAAEAIGSVYHGKKAGSIGDFGVFSFHGTKTITTGEGGMFVTNHDDLYNTVKTLNNHGRSPKCDKQFWAERIGFKYRMSNVQAAIGCVQLERIDELVDKKRLIFKEYERLFHNIEGITMNPEKPGTTNSYWMPTLIFDSSLHFERNKLLAKFKENNIDGRVFFWPLSSLPMFEKNANNIVAYDITERAINLPSYHDLTIEEQKRVFDVVMQSISK